MASGSRDGLVFGENYVIDPTGAHKATIVWLHDLSRTGSDSEKTVKSLRMPNIKWICPTAPIRSITSLAGIRTTAWFDTYGKVSEGMQDDLKSLNYVTKYVTQLLSSEPPHVMIGVGGIGVGAAQALFYASAYVYGDITIDLNMVIGINGWLPNYLSLQTRRISFRKPSLQILVTNGPFEDNTAATFVEPSFVNESVHPLRIVGFPMSLKPCGGTKVMNEIHAWLLAVGLQTSSKKNRGETTV